MDNAPAAALIHPSEAENSPPGPSCLRTWIRRRATPRRSIQLHSGSGGRLCDPGLGASRRIRYENFRHGGEEHRDRGGGIAPKLRIS